MPSIATFHRPIHSHWSLPLKSDEDPDPHRSHWFAPRIWVRIRIEIKKSWIRIRKETNADPQHWTFITDKRSGPTAESNSTQVRIPRIIGTYIVLFSFKYRCSNPEPLVGIIWILGKAGLRSRRVIIRIP